MGKAGHKARERAEVIMKVRCGLMTATEAARVLGVSRKTYYKWEQRGLSALLGGLEDRSVGRPSSPEEEEKEAVFAKQMDDLKKKNALLQRKMELKDLLMNIEMGSSSDRTKKK